MKVPRMPVGGLEPGAAFTEIDLARDTGIDHPLQRPVDRRAADTRMLAAYKAEKIVGAEMTFLFEERPENLFALGRSFAARRAQARDVGKRSSHRDLAIW